VVALLCLVAAGRADAGEPRTHDGLFLRLSGGPGIATTELEGVKLDGSTADLNLAVGAVVSRNLAIHGTYFGWLTSDPDIEISGVGSGTATGDLDLSAFGAGLTYYFMPANIYVSGSAGAGSLTFDNAGTDTGFIGEITAGKEWWVGGSWGLGLNGSFGYHTVPDGDVSGSWSGTSFALRFSATLN
jgi:hypothetical protein